MVIDLKNAIVAIQDKIANSAGVATAEELAYLGTAIDRIGGRATVYDVVEAGELVKDEIVSLGDTLKSEITLDVTTKLNTATAAVDNILANMVNSASATEATTVANVIDKIDKAADTIDSVVEAATSDINSKALELQTAASELSSAASLANTQAVNSSLFTMFALSTLK